MTYKNIFNKKNMGGLNASKIGNQDTVATIYAIELLFNDWLIDIGDANDKFSLSCEQSDDLEVVTSDINIFIQVKSGSFNIKEVLDNFLHIEKEKNAEKEYYYIISAFDLSHKDKSFAMKLSKYHEYKNNKYRLNYENDEQLMVLINNYKLTDYKSIINRLYIDNRPLRQTDTDCKAIFSSKLRKNYGIHDEDDRRVDELFDELHNKFSLLRAKAGSITSDDISSTINKFIVRNTAIRGYELALQYKKENDYYIYNADSQEIICNINNGFQKAIKKLHREWIKNYFKYFILKFLGRFECCEKCGHPLTANFYGLCKGGLACPDCGSQPFLTLISFCECGSYEIICSQPELDDESIYNYVTKFFRIKENRKCKNCGKNLFDDYYDMRITLVPYPADFKFYIERFCDK